ncbi:hypothetical protein Daus18300_012571 [Diaporthe australafricana]|uniref:RBR-type E3 ubiquitin transferase n=1 Tax=Diaporthe australafricana TaxID=127596 RepID=A0ABR3W297_9PEZI
MANINIALAIAKVGIMEELRTVKVATKSELITIVGVITKDHLMELRVTGILRKLKSQGGQTSTASPSDLVDQATEVQLRVVIVTLCEMGLYVKKQVLASFGVLGRQPHKCRNCGKLFCHNENKAKSCHYHTVMDMMEVPDFDLADLALDMPEDVDFMPEDVDVLPEDLGRRLADRVRQARQRLEDAEVDLMIYRQWIRRYSPVLNYEDTLDYVPDEDPRDEDADEDADEDDSWDEDQDLAGLEDQLELLEDQVELLVHHTALNPDERLCVSCRSNFTHTDTHRCPCSHDWCQACVNSRLEAAITSTSMFPAACCDRPILPAYEAFVPLELWGRYQAKKTEVETPNPTYCSKRFCNKFVPPQNINAGCQARCVCGQVTCVDCKAEWHPGRCAVDQAREALLTMAAQEGWQRCIRCMELVERIDGCNEITCACGARFCYACGARWKSCPCPHFGRNELEHRWDELNELEMLEP